jgi:glutamyl/glutaminyl-tRNA synthetase
MIPKVAKRVEKLLNNLSVDFDLSRLSKSPARFNSQKLDWFNKQFLQMLSLEEFSYRAAENKIFRSQQLEGNFRVGDYVMFVDLAKNLAMVEKTQVDGQDGNYYLVGGGRDKMQDGKENLIKEISEEVPLNLDIDPAKILPIANFKLVCKKPFNRENQDYIGKHFFVYFYPLDSTKYTKFNNLESNDDGTQYLCDWHNLEEVLATNDFVTYPIWRDFCEQNNLPVLELTPRLQKQYLAYFLDKNRVTVLSELGLESNSILNWQNPETEILVWKKMTAEQTKNNLLEIWEFLQKVLILDEFKQLQQTLYEAVLTKDLNQKFANLVNFVETKIKTWLLEDEKNTGEYLWPLRVTLSGQKQSSSPFELLSVLKFSEVESRVLSVVEGLT